MLRDTRTRPLTRGPRALALLSRAFSSRERANARARARGEGERAGSHLIQTVLELTGREAVAADGGPASASSPRYFELILKRAFVGCVQAPPPAAREAGPPFYPSLLLFHER